MWNRLINGKRFKGCQGIVADSSTTFYRNSFHKDYDRLIFSNAFRRLSRKTQVHPLSKNDHVHNRLTHSLEVASVGRSLGLRAGLSLKTHMGADVTEHDVAYIVQTACLAHDIGNPPFGHAGEEVIKEWFRKSDHSSYLKELTEQQVFDLQKLDGNAQSFRIVTQLENHQFDGGMQLTLPTLGCLVKYPYSSLQAKKDKFNFFASEQVLFDRIFDEMGLKVSGRYLRHPLSYLMEAADDICYGMLDILDAAELKLISFEDVNSIFSPANSELDINALYKNGCFDSRRLARMTAMTINRLAEGVSDVFDKNTEMLLSVDQPKDLIALFENDSGLKQIISQSKSIAREKIFNDRRKIELELGAYNIIETILSCLIPAAFELHQEKDITSLSFKNRRALELMGEDKPENDLDLYSMYRRVIDYLVGMTDNYAQFIANQLNGVGE
ncbi:deoxyguanosinetriphosphate triphosphohydrolase [Thalassolituus pacificus]|uniref:Deoxyguanosinetriphosphate triphosphohydrolase n=1 Tax=Thalassolituus pacificus TaxID=2975440 RepID=A0A9X3AR54_9GAMM|nr:deoxyguanosinetriphosphate triphosphohydrolase [Thalassolituus pacificus]MCT7358760.1 deoxyguanosinetriphosphate triphosphohydrolase [Thalassolituus pacificus]